MSSRATDLLLAAAIFFVAAWIGLRSVGAFADGGGVAEFYQRRFGPAVMLACGRAFEEPDAARVPALERFLTERSPTFDCARLPTALASSPLDLFQAASRYLLYAAAATWRVAGVSWAALWWVAAVLFGAVASLTYAILRLALSRALALIMLVPAVTSPANLTLLPQLRDYAKGPFLLAAILLMGAIVMHAHSGRRLMGLAVAAGAVVGVGLGFRTDLAIAVVPVVVTLALLTPPAATIRMRAAAVAVFLASFALAGSPILRVYAKGGNTGHVALLGLGTPFDGPLRVQPSVYEFAGQYNDSLAYSIINSYALRTEGRRVILGSAEYEDAARGYLRHVARVFPADLAVRVIAAVRAVPHYFLDTSLFPPVEARGRALQASYHLRASVLSRLAPLAFVAVVLAVLATAMVHPRAAWLAVLVMLSFAGTTALQFHERHFFYLQFVPWLAFGLVFEAAVAVVQGYRVERRRFVRVLATATAVFAAVGLGLVSLRMVQQRAAAELFSRYETATHDKTRAIGRPVGGSRMLVSAPGWLRPLPERRPWIQGGLIAFEFSGERCGGASVPATLRYSGNPPDVDLSEPITVHVGAASGSTVLYAAVFDRADESIRFRGLELPSADVRCVGSVSTVEGLDTTPLLLTTQLAPGWRSQSLFERLR